MNFLEDFFINSEHISKIKIASDFSHLSTNLKYLFSILFNEHLIDNPKITIKMCASTSTHKHVYLSDLHFEHKLWINELALYKDEVATFETRLGDVSLRNTNMEAKAGIEQFQNQFIRQKEVIDELLHDIKIHESELAAFAEDHPIAIDHQHFTDHTALRNNMQTFRDLFTELKNNYMKYLTKWM